MVALNPNKQSCIGKEDDASPQPKQTNLYRQPFILAPAQGSTHLHHVLLNNFCFIKLLNDRFLYF